ncbi:MAG: TetR/AcrR family transcriptional regulator [Pseudomonadales bacterium]|nr:TetR/AcrR family transcriptional regulator [Pseudomonadales bacterium]
MTDSVERSNKNEMRKRQIVEAAVSVLKAKGVAASSMNDFIKASGLSKGGVYHHFGSKEELLIGVLNYFFEQHVSDLDNANSQDKSAYEKMHQLLTEHQEMLERVGDLNQLMMDFFSHASNIQSIKEQFHFQYCHFQDHFASIVKEGIEKGEFKAGIDPRVISSGIIGIFEGIGRSVTFAPDRVDFPAYAVECSLALIDGIRT